jgi:hypothetical protein
MTCTAATNLDVPLRLYSIFRYKFIYNLYCRGEAEYILCSTSSLSPRIFKKFCDNFTQCSYTIKVALTKINMLSKEIGIFYFASLIIIILIAISGNQYGLFSYAVHTAYGESNSIINNINNNKNTTYDISGAKSASITANSTANTAADTSSRDNIVPYVGVDMQGYYTSMPQTRNFTIPYFPSNYCEDNFRLISQSGMNHIRYVSYWESYIRSPDQLLMS